MTVVFNGLTLHATAAAAHAGKHITRVALFV
jgi:hypothetical protein